MKHTAPAGLQRRLTILLLAALPALAGAQVTDTLIQRYCRYLTSADAALRPAMRLLQRAAREHPVSDQNVVELQQRYPVSRREARRLVRTLRPDGSWPDINYADTLRSGWAPKRHVERLHTLARRHWLHPTAATARAIHQALGYWLRRDLMCRNWWYNQIGVPRTLGQACLLFAPELTPAELRSVSRIMQRARLGMTGQNKVWLAGNVLLRGLLEADTALISRARADIASELTAGRTEGIQPDWSFHQHGPQPQWGNYGLSFLCGMSFYDRLFRHTPYAFPPAGRALLDSLLTQGYRWVTWRGRMDVNALGRQLFRQAGRDKGLLLLLTALERKQDAPPALAREISTWADDHFFHPRRPDRLTGYRHFASSDHTVFRTPRWMASLRMASSRVIGTEVINEDNLQGCYMADGALLVYTRGSEYAADLPLWNWRHIPGITAPDTTGPVPRQAWRNRTERVGGLADGLGGGISAMELNRHGVRARKAWIFTPEFILCLGAGIRADRALVTTVDQRRRRGRVWHRRGRWHHDRTGYVITTPLQADGRTLRRRGSWHDVMGMYPPDTVSGRLFELTLPHPAGGPGAYEYVVLPAASRRRTRRFNAARAYRVERNDTVAQAVSIGGRLYVALYHPADLHTSGGLTVRLTVPGLYVINSEGRITASRPFAAMRSGRP